MYTKPQSFNANTPLFDAKARRGALELPHAWLQDGALCYDSKADQDAACRLGAFWLKIPDDFDPAPARAMAREFSRPGALSKENKIYSGYRTLGRVCFLRSAYQMEQLIISREDREAYFPEELLAMCHKMDELSTSVLCSMLESCEIPRAFWDQATGGAARNNGTHWFVCNQYSPQTAEVSGCSAHQDTGFVTVLFFEEGGLEALIDDQWRSIRPEPGFFLVNFGLALSTLTKTRKNPVSAIFHRVVLDAAAFSKPSRISFAAFSSAPTDGALYEYNPDSGLEKKHDVNAFLKEHDLETWKDDA